MFVLKKTCFAGLAGLALITTPAHAVLIVTNGDFEDPTITAGVGTNAAGSYVAGVEIQDVPGWFDSTGNYTSWHRGKSDAPQENGTQFLVMGPGTGNRGPSYVYQSLGTLDADGGILNWSLDQVRLANTGDASAGLYVRFFSGDPTTGTAADGTAIGTLGLTQIGTDATINAFGTDASPTAIIKTNTVTGSVSLAGLTTGTQVWMELEGFKPEGLNGFAPFDNISVQVVPEPGSLGLLGLGGLLMARRRRD